MYRLHTWPHAISPYVKYDAIREWYMPKEGCVCAKYHIVLILIATWSTFHRYSFRNTYLSIWELVISGKTDMHTYTQHNDWKSQPEDMQWHAKLFAMFKTENKLQ